MLLLNGRKILLYRRILLGRIAFQEVVDHMQTLPSDVVLFIGIPGEEAFAWSILFLASNYKKMIRVLVAILSAGNPKRQHYLVYFLSKASPGGGWVLMRVL